MNTVAGGRDSVRNLRPRMMETVGPMKKTGTGNPLWFPFWFSEKFCDFSPRGAGEKQGSCYNDICEQMQNLGKGNT